MPVKLYFTTGISNWLCVNSDSVDTQQPITRAMDTGHDVSTCHNKGNTSARERMFPLFMTSNCTSEQRCEPKAKREPTTNSPGSPT